MADAKHPAGSSVLDELGGRPGGLRSLDQRAHPAQRIALIVTAVFVVVGLSWVFLTDVVLYQLTFDPVLIGRFETAKGWIFVLGAGLLLYLVTLRTSSQLARVWRLTAAVVNSIADGVLLLRHDRTIGHANPAALTMLRCRREELVGMGPTEFSRRFRVSYPNGALVPPEQFASQRVFEEGGPLRYKAVLHPMGGDELVFDATAAAVRMEVDEPPHYVVSVMHDVTEIEQLDRLRDRFFAAAAHSLKTPVAIIKANAEALIPWAQPEQQSMAASLQRQCDRIDRLVQNLLTLARIRSHTLELHPTEMEIGPLVEQIAREPAWSYRHLVLVDVTGALPIQGDEERLALVIRNFMNEACRLSPANSPVTLQAGIEGERVAIGIRYRPLPWRVEAKSMYDEFDDIGIARSVATMLVEGHGGTLTEDATGPEVVVWIRLPSQVGATQ